ncbi:unnamed protein product [Pseudo-nitzschia multistriata]|uniref:Uncharacterized protein n=1 Tax=Pseudo-nitzschia multistriata TaxID=183589 RepID=A0A448ZEZ2_9STRA|nr:unnamed protein product [Pseudo-nitzschia multistriata]
MKTAAILLATVSGVSAFTQAVSQNRVATALSAEPVPLANGAMSFNRVCREWRCKYEGDKATSASLEAIAKVVDESLPEIKKASSEITVNRLVCGGCLDFKLMMTVPLEDFGPWEEAGFPPESDFLAKIKAIEGVSVVETQTITNMEI